MPPMRTKEFNLPSVIVYSRENHQLAESEITNGRGDGERVNRVIVFSGQSSRVRKEARSSSSWPTAR